MSRCYRALVAAIVVIAVTAIASSPAAAKEVPFQPGVTLAGWGNDAYLPKQIGPKLNEIKTRYGARWVTLFAVWSQKDGEATRIHRSGSLSVPDSQLVAAIRAAKSRGLNVVLRPYIDPADYSWRGQLDPRSVSKWFASYREFLAHYAAIAQRTGVNGFVVGSELSSLERYGPQWQRVVREVRGDYRRGFITYQTNWGDTYRAYSWWKRLDAISVSAYFPLTSNLSYTADELVAGWHSFDGNDWFAQVEALQTRLGLPVMFGEIGYRSVVGSARMPWDVEGPGAQSAEAQQVAYEAALRVWYAVPWFAGMYWWYEPAEPLLGRRGADHEPLEPARETVRLWYTGGGR